MLEPSPRLSWHRTCPQTWRNHLQDDRDDAHTLYGTCFVLEAEPVPYRKEGRKACKASRLYLWIVPEALGRLGGPQSPKSGVLAPVRTLVCAKLFGSEGYESHGKACITRDSVMWVGSQQPARVLGEQPPHGNRVRAGFVWCKKCSAPPTSSVNRPLVAGDDVEEVTNSPGRSWGKPSHALKCTNPRQNLVCQKPAYGTSGPPSSPRL